MFDYSKELLSGSLVLYPSDTLWGLGCDATNEEACRRVSKLKKRTGEKSFIVLMDSIEMLRFYVPTIHPVCYELIAAATSPLTIIYPAVRLLASSVVARDGSVGIRITKHAVCLQLIRSMNRPLVSTSANLSNANTPNSFDEISTEIKSGVDIIIDSVSFSSSGVPSRIIRVELDGSMTVIRP